jgi:hypothetical protein
MAIMFQNAYSLTGVTRKTNSRANTRDHAKESRMSSADQLISTVITRMCTPTRKMISFATIPNARDLKIHFIGKTTTETIFETITRKTSAAPKAKNLPETSRISESGTKHRRHGWPSAPPATSTGAVPDALSKTMLYKLVGSVCRARVHAKKTASELGRDLALTDKLQRIPPRLP